MADVTVLNHGTVVQFKLHTDAVRQWVDQNVQADGWQWFGPSNLVIDHRYAGGLAYGIARAGFEVA
jgi:hypothetical protein